MPCPCRWDVSPSELQNQKGDSYRITLLDAEMLGPCKGKFSANATSREERSEFNIYDSERYVGADYTGRLAQSRKSESTLITIGDFSQPSLST